MLSLGRAIPPATRGGRKTRSELAAAAHDFAGNRIHAQESQCDLIADPQSLNGVDPRTALADVMHRRLNGAIAGFQARAQIHIFTS